MLEVDVVRRRRPGTAVVATVVAVLASALTAGAQWSWRMSATTPTDTTPTAAIAEAPSGRIRTGGLERERSVVKALAVAELDGCTSVIHVGHAPLKDAFEFRRATRVLVHQMQAFQELDRVASKVVRGEGGLIGVTYGERCRRP